MMTKKRRIDEGLYLVIDPSKDEKILLDKLHGITQEKIVAVQIWDNFESTQNKMNIVQKVCDLCHSQNIPVLMNNDWEFLTKTSIDGVHFDQIPHNFEAIKKKSQRPFICGITCNNSLAEIRWAETQQLDYISFCSMFLSETANSCELVNFETVRAARSIFSNSIFLAGGIVPDNMDKLDELNYNGVVVVSGVMNTEKSEEAVKNTIKN